jgi:hypothetical protein
VPDPRKLHRATTRVTSAVMVLIGVALLVVTLVNGGGPLAIGVLMGVLFVAAGGARLYLDRDPR